MENEEFDVGMLNADPKQTLTLTTLAMLGQMAADARQEALQKATAELDQAVEDTISDTISEQTCEDCGHNLTMTNAENTDDEIGLFGEYTVSAICDCGAVIEFDISLADAYRLVADRLTKGDEDKTERLIAAWKEAGVCGTEPK